MAATIPYWPDGTTPIALSCEGATGTHGIAFDDGTAGNTYLQSEEPWSESDICQLIPTDMALAIFMVATAKLEFST